MKSAFGIIAVLALAVCSFGKSVPPISEDKALALISGLPEFIVLKQQVKEDVGIDGPIGYAPDPLHQIGLGSYAWQIEVYVIVHDDAETSHGTRWAFFRVNAFTGDIWVNDFDPEKGNFPLITLDAWRARRKRPVEIPKS